MCGCEETAFCYAPKCDRLMRDIEVDSTRIFGVQDLINYKNDIDELVTRKKH